MACHNLCGIGIKGSRVLSRVTYDIGVSECRKLSARDISIKTSASKAEEEPLGYLQAPAIGGALIYLKGIEICQDR